MAARFQIHQKPCQLLQFAAIVLHEPAIGKEELLPHGREPDPLEVLGHQHAVRAQVGCIRRELCALRCALGIAAPDLGLPGPHARHGKHELLDHASAPVNPRFHAHHERIPIPLLLLGGWAYRPGHAPERFDQIRPEWGRGRAPDLVDGESQEGPASTPPLLPPLHGHDGLEYEAAVVALLIQPAVGRRFVCSPTHCVECGRRLLAAAHVFKSPRRHLRGIREHKAATAEGALPETVIHIHDRDRGNVQRNQGHIECGMNGAPLKQVRVVAHLPQLHEHVEYAKVVAA